MQPKKLLAGAFNHLSECRYGSMLYNINDTYIGGSLDRYGEFSEGEVDVFRQVVPPGGVVVDVGANLSNPLRQHGAEQHHQRLLFPDGRGRRARQHRGADARPGERE
jgi:hypothetical protein